MNTLLDTRAAFSVRPWKDLAVVPRSEGAVGWVWIGAGEVVALLCGGYLGGGDWVRGQSVTMRMSAGVYIAW